MDKWTIDEAYKNDCIDSIKNDQRLLKKWDSFEADVTINPYFHPKSKRIAKLQGKTSFPEGTFRYRRDPLRVVYFPEGTTKTIYPLEVATTTQISYKKKTKGK